MQFKNSKYFNSNYKILSLKFGDFYLHENYVIAEIAEGVHIDKSKIEDLIILLVDHYGENLKIGYIFNNINSYSIDSRQWINFNNDYNFIIASAIIFYNGISYINASIEKRLSKNSIKRCNNLDEALFWIENLREFKIQEEAN
ncbi:hypothetical protein [Pontimicrobium sp. SW4]|uniref:STAS/SEC14 domain-containing protein n=1 Tax=Pontimicrobium sp. SW4 TaxID=3153519 RepID=A0AAU7BXH5_9FLAO